MSLQQKINENTVIEIRGLSKSFGENKVLTNFDLILNKGESIAVLGKSGSGKSVLIKCIVGLIQPDKGSIKVFGTDMMGLDADELDKARVRIGFLFQSNALYDSMTVRENLEFPLRRHWIEKTPQEVDTMVKEALLNVGLPDTIDMMPSELSGGMRKRISIARTLILKPDIILYDEPTTGLDPITAKEISQLMVEVQKKYNTSSLIISHDLNCIKITADKLIMLIDGINYAEGTYDNIKDMNDKKVKEFFEL
jgi:phospholipid/cholesterol/gamma-HCH transport system ATP-binding protein